MEDKLFEMLDELDFAETSSLLEENLTIRMDNKIKKRITKSVKNKAGFYNTDNINFIEKIKTNLSYIFPRNRLAISFSFIFLFMGCTYTFAKTPVAFVSLDINPSIEIGINIFERVVSYTPYNDDGNKIISNNTVTNINAESAVNNLVDSAIHEGYVLEDGSTRICIAIASNMNKYLKYEKYLKYAATETLEKNNLHSDIETLTLSLNERKEAKSLGITSGKLDLIKELQSLDSSIKIDNYKNSSIIDIYNKYLELKDKNDIKDVTNNQVLTDSSITNNEMSTNSRDTLISEDNSSSSNNNDTNLNITDNAINPDFSDNSNNASNSGSNNTNSSSSSSSSSSNNSNNNSSSSDSSNSNNNSSGSDSNNSNSNTGSSDSDNTDNSTGNSSSNNNTSDGGSNSTNNSGSNENTADSNSNGNTSNNKPNNGNHHGHNKPNYGNYHGHNKPNNGNHSGHYKPNNGNHNGHYK